MTPAPDLREVLAFELTAQHEGLLWKARAVRARWGVSLARYHQVLNRILDVDAVVVIEPQLVRRLWRLRDRRRELRSVRRVA